MSNVTYPSTYRVLRTLRLLPRGAMYEGFRRTLVNGIEVNYDYENIEKW